MAEISKRSFEYRSTIRNNRTSLREKEQKEVNLPSIFREKTLTNQPMSGLFLIRGFVDSACDAGNLDLTDTG